MQFNIPHVKAELRVSYRECSDRGLIHSGKWLAELLATIKVGKEEKGHRVESQNIDYETEDIFVWAKSLFDIKEFIRCSSQLEKIHTHTSKTCFLMLYSKWLHGEKVRSQEECENPGSKVMNRENDAIYTQIQKLSKNNDPFLWYLNGVILRSIQRYDEAIQSLVNAVNVYPLLWSAWVELSQLCFDAEIFENILSKLKIKHWIINFFIAKTKKELQLNQEALDLFSECQMMFPGSSWIGNEIALSLYNLTEFEKSQRKFEEVHNSDPYCLDNMDAYSNILFVKDEKSNLSALAHTAQTIDKYRPETCLIIGNYYSQNANHTKALIYFKRALKVDPNCDSACTLIGHELMEIKNPHDAIKSYRKSVEINPKDYRAWYGLGQAHEYLRLYLHALFYYQKACALRPYDGRVWCALGNCYELLHKLKDSLRCYERAHKNNDPDGISLYKCGDLHRSMGEEAKAAEYFELLVKEKGMNPDAQFDMFDSNAILFLCNYFKNARDYDKAEFYLNILIGLDGAEKDQAKALLREIRTIRNKSNLPF